jgi:hypothetical protein
MCILNGISIWSRDVILHTFEENLREPPYIYASDKCNNFMCVNIYYVMHMAGGSQQLKFGETYAKSVKIGQPDLGNWIIQFCQQNHKNRNIRFLKLEYPIFYTQHIDKKIYTIHLRHSLTTYLVVHKT